MKKILSKWLEIYYIMTTLTGVISLFALSPILFTGIETIEMLTTIILFITVGPIAPATLATILSKQIDYKANP